MNTDWMQYATCATHPNPDLWFPNQTGPAAANQAREAALICRQCPVRVECGEHRKQVGASAGVWGGAYHHTKPPGKRLAPINHGTNGGYFTHLARGERACHDCRAAHMYTNRKWARR